MVEIVVQKMFLEAGYAEGKNIANEVKHTKINYSITSSKGAFPENLKDTVDSLNMLFLDIGEKMDRANKAIKVTKDEFIKFDISLADQFRKDLIAGGK